MEGLVRVSNTWSNKTVAFHPLIENDKCLGFAVVSKDLKYFYSYTTKYDTLLKDAKNVIVFNGFWLREFFENFEYTKHNLQSLYYQLNSDIKFQTLEDIVKQECYSTVLNSVHYIIDPDKAKNCVIAATFMLEYYLENYRKTNKEILKLDNSLLERFSNRKSFILTDQLAIRTNLSVMQKQKWDKERELFKKVGYPLYNISNNKELDKELKEIKHYKELIDSISKYLYIPKIQLSFNTTATATGRILCRDKINNIGLFAPDNKYKNLFYCKENKRFVSADYIRQEAFILATVSKDVQLYKDIQNDDFYSKLAKWVLGDTSKQTGKTLFYAVIYGSSIKSLAEEFNINEYKAQEAVNKVKNRYKSLNKWLVNFKEKTNFFGRPLYKHTVNAYIQSTAADIIRQKLITTYKYNPVLVLSDNIIYRLSADTSIEPIKEELNNTLFKGLKVRLLTSNSLVFE